MRVGDAAGQLQIDVYGEVAAALRMGRAGGFTDPASAWPMQVRFTEHLAAIWEQPDNGIWESRGDHRHFTHSKVMAWVAVDCAIKDGERFGFDMPLDRWRALRERMHACRDLCQGV